MSREGEFRGAEKDGMEEVKSPGGVRAGELAPVGGQGRPECAGPNALARKFQLIPGSRFCAARKPSLCRRLPIHTY